MANFADSQYILTGNQLELDELYSMMQTFAKEKNNGNWVGHIVEALNGSIPDKLYVRGWWDELHREGDILAFHLESAWEPLNEAWDFIASKFDTLKVYFIGEEPGCELFLKRSNPAREWFTDSFYLDVCTPDGEYIHEYFEYADHAFSFIGRISDTKIKTFADVENLNCLWQNESDEAYIYLHEFQEV